MTPLSVTSYCLRFVLAGVVFFSAGWLLGRPVPALLIFFALFGIWNLFNIVLLARWLNSPYSEKPHSAGMWAMIFNNIGKLRKTGQKKKKQYQTVIQDLQSLTDALPDATLLLDKLGKVTWFNNSARDVLGLDPQRDQGQAVTSLLRSSDFADWLAAQDESKSRFEMASPADQNTWFDVSVVDYRKGQRLLILSDITDIRNANQMRQDFVANISHELRTPLTVLIGYLEMLQDLDEEAMQPVAKMQAQAQKMEELLTDLLELSRVQNEINVGEDEVIDVAAMLSQIREQMDEISKGKHQITMRIEEGLSLLGAASDIESAFRNLLLNGLKYTPEGGKITVCWKATPTGAEFIVTDTGMGIPKRDIPRLTERFYRVNADRSRSTGGTGLGLAIVKHVLLAHQAKLQIESDLGDGSEFRCVFPASRIHAH